MKPVPALLARLLPLLQVGFAVGALRYACEFIAPDYSMWFGLYYVMPVALLVIGLRGSWGDVPWRTVAGTAFLAGLICWGVWNSIAYTTGQFMEWNHGRFFNDPTGETTRAAPVAATTMGKIGWGLAQGGITGVIGGIWCVVFGTILVWLPAKLRAGGRQGA